MTIARSAISRGLALALPLFLLNCAKTGDPQPPFVRVAMPAADLAASQVADGVVLTVSMPSQNTDGSPADPPREIEVFRVTESRRSPLPELAQEEFLARARRLFALSRDFSGFLQDGTLVFRDEIAPADRAAAYNGAFRYAVRFINAKSQTAGLGNQVVITPVPMPHPPADLAAEAGQEQVRIAWSAPLQNSDGSRPAKIAGYRIYRTEDPRKFPPSPLNQALLEKPEYEDRSFQFDKTYYYAVSVVASREVPYAESTASAPLKVATVDRFAPPPPLNLQAIPEGRTVVLLWMAPEAPDLAGYRVYRSGGADEKPRLLQSEPVVLLSYRDESASPAGRFRYSVRAVDTHGNESPPAEVSIEVR